MPDRKRLAAPLAAAIAWALGSVLLVAQQVERFTRLDAGTLEYRFTVDDPTTWTRPWTVAFPMTRTDAPVYEYACHEGNDGLRDILSGARYEEQLASDAEKKRKH